MLRATTALLRPALPRLRAPATLTLSSQTTDGVTGTKFEEPDEAKNPEKRGGHQVKGMAPPDPETMKRMEAVRDHQSNCPRLPWADEIRTITAQPRGFAALSTVSCAPGIEGFPSGSVVGFATLPDGTPSPVTASFSSTCDAEHQFTPSSLGSCAKFRSSRS